MNRSLNVVYWLWVIAHGIFTTALFFPGSMGNDALSQWYQVNGILPVDDWHPPMIVHVWRIVNMFIPGPAGMLILQQVAYWIGIGLLVFNTLRAKSQWLKFVLLSLLGLFPVVWLATATILKDTLMISSLLLATGLFSSLKVDLKRVQFWVKAFCIYVFLLLASGFRHNGIMAVAPLAFLITFWILTPFLSKWMNGTVSLAIVLSLGLFSKLISGAGVDIHHPYLVNQTLFWNLAGLSVDTDSLLIPKEAFTNPDSANVATISRYYQDQSNNKIVFHSGIINPSVWSDDVYGKQFFGHAVTTLLSRPGDYVRMRVRFLRHFSGYGRWRPYGAYIFETKYWKGDEDLGLPMFTMDNPKALGFIEDKLVGSMVTLGLYNVVPYLILGIVELLWLICWGPSSDGSRNRFIFMMLLLSGISYWLPLLLVAPSNDFRYHLWTISSVTIIGVLGLCDWMFGRRLPNKRRHSEF